MSEDKRRSKDIDEAIASLQYEVLDFKTKMELPLSALSDITDKQKTLIEGLSLLDKNITDKLEYLKSREKGVLIPQKSYRELVLNLETLNTQTETLAKRFLLDEKKPVNNSEKKESSVFSQQQIEQIIKQVILEKEKKSSNQQTEKTFSLLKNWLFFSLPLVVIILLLLTYILFKI